MAQHDWENWNEDGLEDFLEGQTTVYPWAAGSHGKFVISPEGELHHWQTDPMGHPHHDDVAARQGLGQILKGDIAPSGAWWITDQLDPAADPTAWAQRVSPQAQKAGLRTWRGYMAKKQETCDRCLQPYETCTCPAGGTWAEEPIADPVRDLRPVSNFSKVIPESRWTGHT